MTDDEIHALEARQFMDLLFAAMVDAVVEGNMTQLQTKLVPPGGTKERVVRIIIVPEEMTKILGGS